MKFLAVSHEEFQVEDDSNEDKCDLPQVRILFLKEFTLS